MICDEILIFSQNPPTYLTITRKFCVVLAKRLAIYLRLCYNKEVSGDILIPKF